MSQVAVELSLQRMNIHVGDGVGMSIQLNFLPLANQSISTMVYRKPYDGQPKQSGYYRARLPKDHAAGSYEDCWVVTQERDGYERYFFTGEENVHLTRNLIWEQFVDRLTSVLRQDEYTLMQRDVFVQTVDIILERYPEGNQVIEIQPYYLKVGRLFGFLVDFVFRMKNGVPYSSRVQQLSLSLNKVGNSNVNYYSDRLDKIQLFLRRFVPRLFPIQIGGEQYTISDSLHTMQPNSLDVKRYLFRQDRESNSQPQGMKSFGPLQTLKKNPLVVCIFKPEHKLLANTFYKALMRNTFNNFSGMDQWFHVNLPSSSFLPIHIDSTTRESIDNVVDQLERIRQQHPDKSMIGVFILGEEPDQQEFSPYSYLKYCCTRKQIPIQTIMTDTLRDSSKLKWSVGGIALQMFAKLGGIPWKVKSSHNRCLIFGIGSAHKQDDDGRIIKHFAYSVCLDSSGIYKQVNVLGDAKDRREYIEQLRANIREAIKENMGRDTNKCVLHLPFKIKGDEMEYIRQGVSEVACSFVNVEFHFIKINTKNRFFGYATNNSKVPYESSYLQLSNSEYLVWFEGLQYGRSFVTRKVGRPVHIKFLGSDLPTEVERKSYLQDIINLSGANWRGFNAKLSPISIFYPDLIAEFIADFRKYSPDDDLDLNDFYLPWFL